MNNKFYEKFCDNWEKMNMKLNVANLVVISMIVLALCLVTPAQAVSHLGIFELDRNAIDNTTPEANPPDDWESYYNIPPWGSGIEYIFILDNQSDYDLSYFSKGGSKDIQNISEWEWKEGDVAPAKDEILNAYAVAYSINDSLILYFGLDRYANNGDAQIGFWFFQNPVGLNDNGTFSGEHAFGDFLVLSHFTKGGSLATIEVFKWNTSADDNLELIATGAECNESTANVCALVNNVTTSSPWPYDLTFKDVMENNNKQPT